MDPTGNNCMNQDRDVKLTNLQFVEQRLLNCNTSFARCTSFLYACLAFIELSQLTSGINMSVQRGARRKTAGGGVEYSLNDAFQIFDTISNSVRLVKSNFMDIFFKIFLFYRYWSKKKLELFSKVENIGAFHMFFTLSCGDYRFMENFTSLLQDEKITYIFKDGQEEILINDLSVEDFLSQNSSKHEFIRSNILTATRNFQHRLKTFIRTIVMNKCGPMNVRYYSLRIEFQLRGKCLIKINNFK